MNFLFQKMALPFKQYKHTFNAHSRQQWNYFKNEFAKHFDALPKPVYANASQVALNSIDDPSVLTVGGEFFVNNSAVPSLLQMSQHVAMKNKKPSPNIVPTQRETMFVVWYPHPNFNQEFSQMFLSNSRHNFSTTSKQVELIPSTFVINGNPPEFQPAQQMPVPQPNQRRGMYPPRRLTYENNVEVCVAGYSW